MDSVDLYALFWLDANCEPVHHYYTSWTDYNKQARYLIKNGIGFSSRVFTVKINYLGADEEIVCNS